MNVNKQAAKDATEYARAQMFFGEGAGIRRKLIQNTVAWNTERWSGYAEAFEKALEKQDWAEHATKAVRERNRIDAGKYINRNARNLLSGNYRNLSTGVAIAAGAWYVAHETGVDEDIKRYVKKQYNEFKRQQHIRDLKKKLQSD